MPNIRILVLCLELPLFVALSGCGGGGSDQGPSSIPAETTHVSFSASVPTETRQAITVLVSPTGTAVPDKALPISRNDPGGPLVLALDGDGNIRLAAPVEDQDMVLSPESTAVALLRIVIGSPPTGTSAAMLNREIRSALSYPALQQEISTAIDRGELVSSNATIGNLINAVVSELATGVLSANSIQPPKERALTIAMPRPVPPLSYPVVNDSFGKSVILSGNLFISDVGLKNLMPIEWSATTTASEGQLIQTIVLAPNFSLLATELLTSPIPIGTNGGAVSLTVEQTLSTKLDNFAEAGYRTIEFGIGLIPGNTCGASVLKASIKSYLQNRGTALTDLSALLKDMISVGSVKDLLNNCTGGSISSFLEPVIQFLGNVSGPLKVYKGTVLASVWFYTIKYTDESQTIGICQNYLSAIAPCVTQILFKQPVFYADIGAELHPVDTLGLEFLAANGSTVAPFGLQWVTIDSSLRLDPVQGVVVTTEPTLSGVTALDPATGVQGQYGLVVVNPVVQPRDPFGEVRLAPAEERVFFLGDGDGHPLIAAKNTTWDVEDKAIAEISPKSFLTACPTTDSSCVVITGKFPGTTRVVVTNGKTGQKTYATIRVSDECASTSDATIVRLPSVCFRASAYLTAGQARPIADFIVIDLGNDPLVTYIFVGVNFFADTPSPLQVLGASPVPGDSYYFGRLVYPDYGFTAYGTDIYYSCQGLPQPHPTPFSSASLTVSANYTDDQVGIPLLVVQYQRLSQPGATCENGWYMPFQRVNIFEGSTPVAVRQP